MLTDLSQESSFAFGSVVPLLPLWLILNRSLDFPFQGNGSPGRYQWVLSLSWNGDLHHLVGSAVYGEVRFLLLVDVCHRGFVLVCQRLGQRLFHDPCEGIQ